MKYKTLNTEKFGTPYSDAIEVGDLIEFSGMLGNTEDGVVPGGFEASNPPGTTPSSVLPSMPENSIKSPTSIASEYGVPNFSVLSVLYFIKIVKINISYCTVRTYGSKQTTESVSDS